MATAKTPTEEPVKKTEEKPEVQYPDVATRHYHEMKEKKQKKE